MNLNYNTSIQNKKTYNPKLAKLPDSVYIPSWLLQIPSSKLSYQAKLLYGRLSQWVNQHGIVYRSAKQLTHELGMSLSSVERTLKELRDTGLIDTYQNSPGGINHYIFFEHEWMQTEIHNNLRYWGDNNNELSTDSVDNSMDNSNSKTLTPPHNWGTPSPTSDGTNKIEKKELLKEASLKEASLKKSSLKPNTAIKLPAALESMQSELNIHPAGILKLMAIAKVNNQRLHDIWQAKRENLLNAGVKEGRAFLYVKFLLETGEDFAYRAQLIGLKKIPVIQKKHTDYRHYWNKKFTDESGQIVRIHGDGSGTLTNVTQSGAYVRPADVIPICLAIEDGRFWLVEE